MRSRLAVGAATVEREPSLGTSDAVGTRQPAALLRCYAEAQATVLVRLTDVLADTKRSTWLALRGSDKGDGVGTPPRGS